MRISDWSSDVLLFRSKTLLGLELAVEAARTGHRSFFFSLEETESSISKRLQGLGFDMDDTGNALVIDTSDAICADYIIERVGHGQANIEIGGASCRERVCRYV